MQAQHYQRKRRPVVAQDVKDRMINYPLPNDVIVEKDIMFHTTHRGNVYLLNLLIAEKDKFKEKWGRERMCTIFLAQMAQRVFSKIKSQIPPGSFLKANAQKTEWENVGLEEAMKAILFCYSKVMLQVDPKENGARPREETVVAVAVAVAAAAAALEVKTGSPRSTAMPMSLRKPPSLSTEKTQQCTSFPCKYDINTEKSRRSDIFDAQKIQDRQKPEAIEINLEDDSETAPMFSEADGIDIDSTKRSSTLSDMNIFLDNQIKKINILNIRAYQQMIQREIEYENTEEYFRLLKDYKHRLELFEMDHQNQKQEYKYKMEQKVQEFRFEFEIAVNELMRKQKIKSEERKKISQQVILQREIQKMQSPQQTNGNQDRQQGVNGFHQQGQQPVLQQQEIWKAERAVVQQMIQVKQKQIKELQRSQEVMRRTMMQSRQRVSIQSTLKLNPQFDLVQQTREQSDQKLPNGRNILKDIEPRNNEPRSPRRAQPKRRKTHTEETLQPKQKQTHERRQQPKQKNFLDVQIYNELQRLNAKDMATNKQQNSSGYSSDDSGGSLVF